MKRTVCQKRSPRLFHFLTLIGIVFGAYNGVSVANQTLYVDVSSTGSGGGWGTLQAPLASIQEAINRAQTGDTIRVQPGIYREHIDFLGKAIHLLGADPTAVLKQDYPVLMGIEKQPVVRFASGEGPQSRLTGFIIRQGGDRSGGAIHCLGSHPVVSHCLVVGHVLAETEAVVSCRNSHAQLLFCTLTDNYGRVVFLDNSSVTLANSIVWGNVGPSLVVEGGMTPLVRYSNIAGSWPGPGNIDIDPHFVAQGAWVDVVTMEPIAEPNNVEFAVWQEGDYHVLSQAGRWDPNAWTWVVDEVTSPCIDGGDPTFAFDLEPKPTGDIANIGVYGGTNQASRSYITDRPARFHDANLKFIIEDELGIFDPTPAELLDLTHLDQISQGVIHFRNLSGIEPAINLRFLKLNEHTLPGTSWLSGLTNLKHLDVSDQYVGTNLMGVRELIHLEHLNIHLSGIYDIRPLVRLTNLRELIMRRNYLSGDLEPLRGMTLLEHLDVSDNSLSDLSALENMTNLKRIIIFGNSWGHGHEDVLDRIRWNNPGIIIEE